jgi:hypothetical protein
MLVLADRITSLGLTVLLINVPLGLLHYSEAHWQRHFQLGYVIQGRDEVDAFDCGALGVVIVPGDDVVLIGVRLLGDGVVYDDTTIRLLDGSHMRLDEMPQVALAGPWTFQVTLPSATSGK